MVTTSVLQRQLSVLEQRCLPLPVAHLFPFLHFSRPILFNSEEKEKKMFFPFSYSEHSNCLQPKPFYPPWLILCLSRCFLLQGHFPQKARMGKNGQGEVVLVCVVISTVILLEMDI